MDLSSDEAPAALHVVVTLFQRLNEEGIRYCHWKSTYRLPEALAGQTDLDILVDRAHSQRFREMLYQCDFKPFVSHPQRQFPAIEDYLGFDPATGHLIHLRIHYRLVLGEQFAKNYYLSLEKSFLDSAQLRWGVKVPAPALEVIVLVLRALLKYRDRDVLRDILNIGRSSGIPPAILNEFEYLMAQTHSEAIACALDEQVDFIPSDLVLKFLTTIQRTPRAGWTLYWLRRRVRHALVPYQRYNRLRARSLYYRIMLSRQWPLKRLLGRFALGQDKHKIPVSGGLTVAFVGADGAGKTTIVQHIVKWLSWRLNVRTYYMGSTRPSLLTKALQSLAFVAQLFYAGCRRLVGETSTITRFASGPKRLFDYLRCLGDGRDRYSRYLAGRRKAAQGSIVIYDRYPLEAVRIFNRPIDGPRIASTCNGYMSVVTRHFSQVEEHIYHKILPAEHVFVLHVSPGVSQARKPDHKWAVIEAKSQAIEQIARDGLDLIDIDADQPFEQVVLQIKAHLWRLL